MLDIANNPDNLKNKIIALVGSNSIHTLRYLTAISKYFKKVIFITNGNWQDETQYQNVTTYILNFKLLNIKSRKKISNILLKEQVEIVHVQQANSYAYHTLKAIKKYKIKCKTLLTTWGSDILILPNKNRFLKNMVKFNIENVDIITSDSLYMSSQITRLSDKINGIYTINFGIQDFPRELELSQKQDIILSNRLHKPLYNIDKIIHGFANFIKNSKYAHYKLVIAASGTETDNLIKLVKDLNITNSVTFTGMLSYKELVEYYKIAKIFISVPDSDATSLSVLEAMGYGCYPILSNIPANLEWVLDGINGIICQNNSYLDNYITSTLNTDLNQIAEFNYKLISEKAVFDNNLQKFLQLYY